MNRNLKSWRGMVLVAFVACAILRAEAASRSWTNTAGGSWEVPGNWSPNGSPTNTDSIFITANGTYTVDFDNTTADTGDATSWLTVFETRVVGDGVGGVPNLWIDFTNTAKQLMLTYTGGDALQASSGGNITLNNGRVAIAGGYLIGSGTTGTVNMTGGFLGMGAGSTIGNQGIFTQSGGIQTGTVFFLAGRMNLTGGSVQSSGSFILGNTAGQHGVLAIDGGSLTNTATFYIGNSGRGTFVMSNGTFSANNISFGDNAGFGSGGDWNMYGGTANVLGNLTLGTASSSTGSILVAGGTLFVTNSTTTVGGGGVGTFVVSNGIFNGRTVLVAGPKGRFEIDGGVANVSLSMTANSASTGTIASAGGVLTVGSAVIGSTQNGAWLISGGSNNITGSLSLGDSASGRGTIVMNGGSLDVGGTVYYNSGRGTIIVSNGTFRANAISMGDNGGLGAGGDFNVVGGTASVAGTLRVGNQSSATGAVLVANSGLLELKSSLTLGHATLGLGTLTNRNGGTLRFTGMNNPGITVNAGSTAVMQNATLEFKDAAAASLSGNITKITQVGDNTLSLNHASNSPVASYTFQTNNGQNFAFLNLSNGGAFLSTATTVGSGGRISGAGRVSGSLDVNANGSLLPGDGANFGTLTIGNGLTLQSSSILRLDLGASQYDQIAVIGNVSLSNSILQLNPLANITTGVYVIVDNDGVGDLVAGMFQGLTNNAFIDASAIGFDAYFRIQYNAGDGNNVILLATIPEPSTWLLLVFAAGALLWRRRS